MKIKLGEKAINNEFPAFYALDLISFGVSRRQPEAIRLGE